MIDLKTECESVRVEHDINKRWEQGIPHHPRAEHIARGVGQVDLELCDDSFCWKFGGDGDNGETLMYEMSILFELEEALQRMDDSTCVVLAHKRPNGVVINALDLMDHIGLTNLHLLHSPPRPHRYVMDTQRPYNVRFVQDADVFRAYKNIVTDTYTLSQMDLDTRGLSRLIVFDTLDDALFCYTHDVPPGRVDVLGIDYQQIYRRTDEFHMIVSPHMEDLFIQKKHPAKSVVERHVRYKKINERMTKAMRTQAGAIPARRWDPRVLDADVYEYKRRRENAYIEHFGRMVFEKLVQGKQVRFVNDEKVECMYDVPDGLEDALNPERCGGGLGEHGFLTVDDLGPVLLDEDDLIFYRRLLLRP